MVSKSTHFPKFIFSVILGLVSQVCAQSPPTCAPPPKGLIGWWAADKASASIASDIADGNPGSMTGGVTIIAVSTTIWQKGSAFAFDGSGFINMADSPSLNFGTTDPFSLEGWFNWGDGGDSVQNIVPRWFRHYARNSRGLAPFCCDAGQLGSHEFVFGWRAEEHYAGSEC